MNRIAAAALAAAGFAAGSAGAEQIGEVTTAIKILGANHRIVVEAFDDPKVEGVACFVSRARTGGISGSLGLAEDTSDASINCQQTGPVTIGDIDLSKGGEEVFREGLSLIWKKLVVTRIYDKPNNTLIYLAHSRELTDGSAKMSISTVPLFNQPVTWKNGPPK